MADTDTITLSQQTHTAVQGVIRSRHELDAWSKNLESALADDVAAGRLTPDEASVVAKANGVKAPPAPEKAPEAKETTPEANQAQLDAQAKDKDEDDKEKAKPTSRATHRHR